ncbi:MAG: low molecular weight phosphotyrosine protein phosphatase [Rhodoferax sp.]|nr:low molecular weight phosphotyrosine protein phosphatase [Rhodoferax sp.]
MKLLMVCMGNVCRSPMAQVVTLHMAGQAGLARDILVDSAGTHADGSRETPDPRAKLVLAARGYPVGTSRARQVIERDFARHDLILAMDQVNLNELQRLCPAEHAHKLHLFLEFAQGADGCEIPDPYYGNVEGFERVLDLCEAGARALIDHLQNAPATILPAHASAVGAETGQS